MVESDTPPLTTEQIYDMGKRLFYAAMLKHDKVLIKCIKQRVRDRARKDNKKRKNETRKKRTRFTKELQQRMEK